jgi:hypothetical protein
MANFFRVAITLAIGALGNVSFVIGNFKFNLTLLEVWDRSGIGGRLCEQFN